MTRKVLADGFHWVVVVDGRIIASGYDREATNETVMDYVTAELEIVKHVLDKPGKLQ